MAKLKFYGGTEEVGNVRITLEHNGQTVCLDYGSKQDHEDDDKAFPRSDYVVVSHAHLDHVGNLPFSLKLNPGTRYVGTEMTKKITEYQLNDILKIAERRKREGVPGNTPAGRQFTLDDILAIKTGWVSADYNDTTKVGDFDVKLVNAGHIPGSAITEVTCGTDRIVYTGDVNLEGDLQKELPGLGSLQKDPKALIIESTYGKEARDPIDKQEQTFIRYVEEAMSKGKNVFVPAFAIERMQRVGSLLSRIRDDHPDYEFYMVSPSYLKMKDMAYRDIDLSNLTESAGLPNDYRGRKSVIVSTSGFCTGGISSKILREVIENKNYTIIVPSGFLPGNSPLKSAVDTGYAEFSDKGGAKVKKRLRAELKQVKLSAHSDKGGLVKIVETVCPDKTTQIYLVHGEPSSQAALTQELAARGYQVKIPKKYEEFCL